MMRAEIDTGNSHSVEQNRGCWSDAPKKRGAYADAVLCDLTQTDLMVELDEKKIPGDL